ncbi:integrase core domain-containing protein [Paucibacter hankyongi]|uniref:integrase core domain-containing protein n=1 Tax=Paucibacter hankyongi TaxID=3133434 RepID=UPI004035EBF0
MDNGPEMSSHDFVEWAQRKGIALNYIEPGEPNQNAYIERFNRTFRTECARRLHVQFHRTSPSHHRRLADPIQRVPTT